MADVLIVDDERDLCALIARLLDDRGHATRCVASGEAAGTSRRAGTHSGLPPCFSTRRESSRLMRDSSKAMRGERPASGSRSTGGVVRCADNERQ